MPTEITYFTCVLSFPTNPDHRTAWHPYYATGKRSRLTRGAFDTEQEAHDWASEQGIHPSTYTVQGY